MRMILDISLDNDCEIFAAKEAAAMALEPLGDSRIVQVLEEPGHVSETGRSGFPVYQQMKLKL